MNRLKPPSMMKENEIDIELEMRGVEIALIPISKMTDVTDDIDEDLSNDIDAELAMRKVNVPIGADLKKKRELLQKARLTEKRRLLWAARLKVGEHVRKHKGDHGQKNGPIPSLFRTDRVKGTVINAGRKAL